MRNLFLLAVAAFALEVSFADCVTLPGRDGAMAAKVCTPDQGASAPLSSWGNPPAWHGRSNRGPSPLSRAPDSPSATPNQNWPTSSSGSAFKLPTINPPATPPAVNPPPPLPPFTTSPFPPPPDLEAQARSNAAGAGAVFALRAAAHEQALKIAQQNKRDTEAWLATNSASMEKGHGELLQYVDQIDNDLEAERSPNEDENGLISSNQLSNPEVVALRSRISLRSGANSQVGRDIRHVLNRAYKAADSGAPIETVEQAELAVAMTLAADDAHSDGKSELTASLLRVAANTIDLGLGLIPVVASANDAAQVMLGVITGYDLAGYRMEAGDYVLRSVGVVLGMLPIANAGLRFGALVIDRTALFVAHSFRGMSFAEHVRFWLPVTRLVQNEFGAIGSGLHLLIKYQIAFAHDSLRFTHMVAALQAHNHYMSVSARKLMQHFTVAGYESADAFRAALRTNAARDLAAEDMVFNMLKNGERTEVWHDTRKLYAWAYTLPNGHSVRFEKETGKFITFIPANIK